MSPNRGHIKCCRYEQNCIAISGCVVSDISAFKLQEDREVLRNFQCLVLVKGEVKKSSIRVGVFEFLVGNNDSKYNLPGI